MCPRCLLLGFSCYCYFLFGCEGIAVLERDNSGMVTVKDLIQLSTNMCASLSKIQNILDSRVFSFLGLKPIIHGVVLPVPNPLPLVDPLGIVRFLTTTMFSVSGFLGRLGEVPDLSQEEAQAAIEEFALLLNQTINVSSSFEDEKSVRVNCSVMFLPENCTEEVALLLPVNTSVYEQVAQMLWSPMNGARGVLNPGNAFLTIGHLIETAEFMCGQVDKWKDSFEGNGVLGFFKLGDTWFPIRDARYPLDVLKLLDPWEIHLVPGKLFSEIGLMPGKIVSAVGGFVNNLFGGSRIKGNKSKPKPTVPTPN